MLAIHQLLKISLCAYNFEILIQYKVHQVWLVLHQELECYCHFFRSTVPIGYSDLGYSGHAAYSNLNPNGTWSSCITLIATALPIATSTPVTEASRYIQCALYFLREEQTPTRSYSGDLLTAADRCNKS